MIMRKYMTTNRLVNSRISFLLKWMNRLPGLLKTCNYQIYTIQITKRHPKLGWDIGNNSEWNFLENGCWEIAWAASRIDDQTKCNRYTEVATTAAPRLNHLLSQDGFGPYVNGGEGSGSPTAGVEKDVPNNDERQGTHGIIGILGVVGPDLVHGWSPEAQLVVVKGLTPVLWIKKPLAVEQQYSQCSAIEGHRIATLQRRMTESTESRSQLT